MKKGRELPWREVIKKNRSHDTRDVAHAVWHMHELPTLFISDSIHQNLSAPLPDAVWMVVPSRILRLALAGPDHHHPSQYRSIPGLQPDPPGLCASSAAGCEYPSRASRRPGLVRVGP